MMPVIVVLPAPLTVSVLAPLLTLPPMVSDLPKTLVQDCAAPRTMFALMVADSFARMPPAFTVSVSAAVGAIV